jgi:hypothetical protein
MSETIKITKRIADLSDRECMEAIRQNASENEYTTILALLNRLEQIRLAQNNSQWRDR